MKIDSRLKADIEEANALLDAIRDRLAAGGVPAAAGVNQAAADFIRALVVAIERGDLTEDSGVTLTLLRGGNDEPERAG